MEMEILLICMEFNIVTVLDYTELHSIKYSVY